MLKLHPFGQKNCFLPKQRHVEEKMVDSHLHRSTSGGHFASVKEAVVAKVSDI